MKAKFQPLKEYVYEHNCTLFNLGNRALKIIKQLKFNKASRLILNNKLLKTVSTGSILCFSENNMVKNYNRTKPLIKSHVCYNYNIKLINYIFSFYVVFRNIYIYFFLNIF